jgi:TPR repeat protein
MKTLAKKGNIDAQYYLANYYMDGVGVKRNKTKALIWF